MEFLRFGSSIPGSYWGCCACDIIQNFKVDPDAKASIQLSSGDGGGGLGDKFVGGTWKDIFLQRLRIGTFADRPMPNHAFIAILTSSQISSGVGQKWMKILKQQGFEFIRRVDNSVYSGGSLGAASKVGEANANYIFMLVRNIGTSAFKDQFTPPPGWAAEPQVIPELWQVFTSPEIIEAGPVGLTKAIHKEQKKLYEALPESKRYTEALLDSAGIPVTYSGIRSGGSSPNSYHFAEGAPQENRENRKRRLEERNALRTKALPSNAFPSKLAAPAVQDESMAEMG